MKYRKIILLMVLLVIILGMKSVEAINLDSYNNRIFTEEGWINEEYFHEYETGGKYGYGKYDFSNSTGINLSVNYYWLHALNEEITTINSNAVKYTDIAKDNSQENIEKAIKILWDTKQYINTFKYVGNEVSDGMTEYITEFEKKKYRKTRQVTAPRSVAAFRNITGYKAKSHTKDDPERAKFVNNIDAARRELNAARDIKRGKSEYDFDINHDYKTKFQYTQDQINRYTTNEYGRRYNLTGDEYKNVKSIWEAKMGLYTNIYDKKKEEYKKFSKALTMKDLYVSKDDSYKVKMSYGIEQVWAYHEVYGWDYSNLSKDEEKTLKEEWNSIYKGDGHTAFYNKNLIISPTSGNTTFNGNVNTDAKGETSDLDNAKDFKEDGSNYMEEHQNDFSNKYYNDDSGIDENDLEKKDDPDKDTVFKQPERDTAAAGGVEDAINDADKFVSSGNTEFVNDVTLQSFSQNMYGILLAVGVVIAVIIGTILGIKLMIAPIEERVEAKKLLVPYVVGCIVVFGAFGTWKLIVTIMQGL